MTELEGEYETDDLPSIQVEIRAEYGREYAETCYKNVMNLITRTLEICSRNTTLFCIILAFCLTFFTCTRFGKRGKK